MDKPTRSYELQFEERPEYLYARVKASTLTGETARAYFTEIMDEADRLGHKWLMIERDIPVVLSTGNLFFWTSEFIKMIRGMRVVFINPYPQLDNAMELAMSIGTNDGAIYTVVRDVESAEKWLLG